MKNPKRQLRSNEFESVNNARISDDIFNYDLLFTNREKVLRAHALNSNVEIKVVMQGKRLTRGYNNNTLCGGVEERGGGGGSCH